MVKIESFHSRRSGAASANVGAAVAETAQLANATLTEWQQHGQVVNVLAAATQLTLADNNATHVLTLVVDVQARPLAEESEITYEDTLFE